MKRLSLLIVALALLGAPTAQAKFSISLVVRPASPVPKQPVRMIMRTGVALPKKHDMELFAVGPWRDKFGVTSFEIRLVRTGPRAFKATTRFPHAGRWRLIVPNWGGRLVTVRPRR